MLRLDESDGAHLIRHDCALFRQLFPRVQYRFAHAADMAVGMDILPAHSVSVAGQDVAFLEAS